MLWIYFVLSLILFNKNSLCEEVKTYEGYKLYSVVPSNVNQTDFLHNLPSEGVDFLNLARIPNTISRAVVSPNKFEEFENVLKQNNIEYKLVSSNLSQLIKTESKKNAHLRTRTIGRIGFNRYYSAQEINEYLNYLAIKYPRIVSVKSVGKSYEGRELKTITISNNVKDTNKKILFIDAGIHAREWISPSMALYIIHQLVENYDQNKELLQNTDVIVLPQINPDGYEYTRTYDRLWRKTRKPNYYCVGSDANRNFGFHWGEIGVSQNECEETYPGQAPFSESESQVLRDVLHSLTGRAKMYLSLHSYGSYILYPWGWTRSRPNTYQHIHYIAQSGANAIAQASGHRFRCGGQIELLYPASGGSHDYALGVAKIPISMTMELPYGGDGFHPGPSEIQPIVQAVWPGIKAMMQALDQVYQGQA